MAGEFVWRLSRNKPLRARKPLSSEPEEVELTSPSFEREGRWGGEALATYTEIPTYVRLVFVGLGVSTLFLLIRAIYRLVEVRSFYWDQIPLLVAYPSFHLFLSLQTDGEAAFSQLKLTSTFLTEGVSLSQWPPSMFCIPAASSLNMLRNSFSTPTLLTFVFI